MLTAPPRDADVSLPDSPQPDAAPTGTAETQEMMLTWTVHLLRGRAGRLPRIVMSILFVTFCGLLVFHNSLLALLPALALLLSLSEFLFPIRYTLTPRHAQARQGPMTLEIAWGDVRHAYLAPDGVKLSPLKSRNSRLEPLRGVFLRFSDNEEAVTAAVRRLRAENAARV